MYDINTIIQNILYSPSFDDSHAQARVEQAKTDYQDRLSTILTQGSNKNG